jgi:tripartite-type tricarboxylate transporter receptor subunit TctC
MHRRHAIQLAATALAAPLMEAHAQATPFPAKPIKLVIAFPAGGPTDITMRVAGRQRQQDPGPAGDRGKQARCRRHPARTATADLPADGYTVAQIPLGVFRLPYTTKINWDPVKDISYVLNVTGYAFGLVVPADSPLKTWTHFVAVGQGQPRQAELMAPPAP